MSPDKSRGHPLRASSPRREGQSRLSKAAVASKKDRHDVLFWRPINHVSNRRNGVLGGSFLPEAILVSGRHGRVQYDACESGFEEPLECLPQKW